MTVLEIFQHGIPLAWDTCHPDVDVFEKAASMQSRVSFESGLSLAEVHESTMIRCSVLKPLTIGATP